MTTTNTNAALLDAATFAWACAAVCAACAADNAWAPAVWDESEDAYLHFSRARALLARRCDATVLRLAWHDAAGWAEVSYSDGEMRAQIGLGL